MQDKENDPISVAFPAGLPKISTQIALTTKDRASETDTDACFPRVQQDSKEEETL